MCIRYGATDQCKGLAREATSTSRACNAVQVRVTGLDPVFFTRVDDFFCMQLQLSALCIHIFQRIFRERFGIIAVRYGTMYSSQLQRLTRLLQPTHSPSILNHAPQSPEVSGRSPLLLAQCYAFRALPQSCHRRFTGQAPEYTQLAVE
jgi:hypothetical protein